MFFWVSSANHRSTGRGIAQSCNPWLTVTFDRAEELLDLLPVVESGEIEARTSSSRSRETSSPWPWTSRVWRP
jgi:hypothetical protein